MFNSSYPFKFLFRKKIEGEPYNAQHRFSFRCKMNLRHFVIVDEFGYNFYAVKFYPQSLEHSPKKYTVLTGNNDASVKINTCLEIMAYILHHENALASFGFTGVHSENEDTAQPSKRFRLYTRVMKQFFSPKNFMHYEHAASNAYFLINRKVDNTQELLDNITSMLQEYYEF